MYQLLHIVRDFRVERQAFTCGGMFESQGFRMQCLSGTNFEAVVDKLFVPGKGGTFQNFISPVFFIVEKRVFDIFEMSTDLMGSAGFQNTFNYVHIAQAFQYPVMRYGVFAMTAVRKTGHDFAVGQVAPDMSGDRSGFVFQVTPTNGYILPVGSLVEKLSSQMGFGLFGFGDDQ